MRSRSLLLLALSLVLAVVACGPTGSALYARVSEPTFGLDDPLPVPAGEPTLTVSGAISHPNRGAELALDVATIEQLGLVRYTVHDPWLEQELEFTGVLLSDILDYAGASPNATSLRITALDDYEVTIAIADVDRWPVMLATRTNGEAMTIDEKGPTRVVFPPDPAIDVIRYKDLWIWQLTSIRVD